MKRSTRFVASLAAGVLTTLAAHAQADVAPLDAPPPSHALRGVTVVVDPRDGGDAAVALRAANYLARILERSGAGVAMTRTGLSTVPHLDAAELAERAGASLIVLVSGEAPGGVPVAVPSRETPEGTVQLEDALVEALRQSFSECDHGKLPVESRRPTVLLRPLGVPPGDDAAPLRRHRPSVLALFESVSSWAGAERTRIEALPRASVTGVTDGEPRGTPFWPIDRAPRTEAEVAGLIAGWRRGQAMDATQVWLDVAVHRRDDGWELIGSTELPSLERALRRMLQHHGVKPLSGELRELPDPALGDDPYGITKAEAALTWATPGSATGLRALDGPRQVEETELRAGEPVRLLDERDGHLLVHALSGYLGWVPASAIERCTESRHREAVDRATGPAERGAVVAEDALSNLGIPYVFGGRSATGLDCSGLCQTAWSAQGVFLARDARMLFLAGVLVSTRARPAPLRPGDLLFFTDGSGRITHIGLSIGGSRFVHATPPEVTVASIDPQDPWFDASDHHQFVAAKRPAH